MYTFQNYTAPFNQELIKCLRENLWSQPTTSKLVFNLINEIYLTLFLTLKKVRKYDV